MSAVASFNRTLDQELAALIRGVSLECLVCGEFVLHDGATVRCPECDMTLHGRPESASVQVELDLQAG